MSADPAVVILAGVQHDGVTYQLHPISRRDLAARFPGISKPRAVFIGTDTQSDFEAMGGSILAQVALLLTGLSLERLHEVGRVVIRIPGTDQEIEVAA